MATGSVRDPDVLRAGLERWLRRRWPDRNGVAIESFEHASTGFSNETVLLTAGWDEGGARRATRLVVRIPAIEPMHPYCDLGVEARTHAVLAAAGVPAPVPAEVERDVDYIGVDFLVMPFVAGQVGPQTPSIDPWLLGLTPERQRRVSDAFVDLLAGVHRVELEGTGLASVLHGHRRSATDEVEWWGEYLQWAAGDEQAPAVVADLLSWCREQAPGSAPEPSLLWGDARMGNAIFGADLRVAAALDWDMAFIGPAEHDVGWCLGLDELTCALVGRRVPGFPARDEVIARYERRLGRGVVDLEWYEIFALVRSIAVAYRLHRLATGAGRPEVMPSPEHNPVVAYVDDLIARWG